MKPPQGFVWLPILVIVGLVILGGGAYWYVQSQQAAQPPPALQPATPQTNSQSQPQPAAPTQTRAIDASTGANFTAIPTSGSAPLAVSFSTSGGRAQNGTLYFGDGDSIRLLTLFGNSTSDSAGYCGASPDFFCTVHHVYSNSGTYIAIVKDSSGTVLGTQTITAVSSQEGSVSAPSTRQYIDVDFGFSFWYPTGWHMASASPSYPDYAYQKKSFYLVDATDKTMFIIYVVGSAQAQVAGWPTPPHVNPSAVAIAPVGANYFVSFVDVNANGVSPQSLANTVVIQ